MKSITRRAYVSSVGISLALVELSVSTIRPAYASGKISKLAAGYVSHAVGAADCSTCANFVESDSTCQIVAGKVSPKGFCNYYSPTN